MKPCSGFFCAWLILLAWMLLATPAQARKVDLALVLLIDDSGSIDEGEARMQRSGYAAAFRSPDVLEAMTRGPNKAIGVSVVMFTDQVRVMIPWRVLDGRQSAEAFAAQMESLPRMPGAATHIGKGLEYSINHLSRTPFEFYASTIDLSADGWDNQYAPPVDGTALITGMLGAVTGLQIGLPSMPDPVGARKLAQLRDYAKSRGITINCIAIEDPSLRDYFSRYVMTGPHAFTLFAPSFRAFTDAIQRKLLREIREGIKVSEVRQQKAPPARAVASPTPSRKVQERPTEARVREQVQPSEIAAQPGEPAEVVAPPAPAAVIEVTPPVELRYSLLVRDAVNDFPVDEVRIEVLPPAELLAQDVPEGRPGLILLDIRTPANSPPKIRLAAPLYLPLEMALRPEPNEARLERMPLRVVW